MVTVSVGVLQSGAIAFSPAIPKVADAVKKLGFGPVIKTILQFKEPFWKNKAITQGKNLDRLSFMFSKAVIPTWWTYFPKNVSMLTGWSGGPHARAIKNLSKEEILQKAMTSLSEIFGIERNFLAQSLTGWQVADWVNDPFVCGGYSYDTVNGSKYKQVLKQPVENTLFFSGEGLFEGPEIGTVEAALQTGRETAHKMIATFKT